MLSPGIWRRSGASGRITGLDHAAALALLGPIPAGIARVLLLAAEAGVLQAVAEQDRPDDT